MNRHTWTLAAGLVAMLLAAGCGGGSESPSTRSATSAAAPSSPALAPSQPSAESPAATAEDPVTDAPAATDDALPTEAGTTTADTGSAVGYTCLYADVDGNVEVPCDSDVCVQVGCLRSDGVYIGPAADQMNSANAPTPQDSAGGEPDDLVSPTP